MRATTSASESEVVSITTASGAGASGECARVLSRSSRSACSASTRAGSLPSSAAAELSATARDHSVFLVIGVIERDGGTLYCTVLFFDPSGELLGKHRKLIPTATERLIWGCGDGSTLAAVNTELGKLGALICWENYMPLARMAMYAQGVQIYCAPTVDDRDAWIPSVRHIAREGRCFVLSSCQFLTRAAYPAAWQI